MITNLPNIVDLRIQLQVIKCHVNMLIYIYIQESQKAPKTTAEF